MVGFVKLLFVFLLLGQNLATHGRWSQNVTSIVLGFLSNYTVLVFNIKSKFQLCRSWSTLLPGTSNPGCRFHFSLL
jgi:hypothetical protein